MWLKRLQNKVIILTNDGAIFRLYKEYLNKLLND